jgi:hypothetical protein
LATPFANYFVPKHLSWESIYLHFLECGDEIICLGFLGLQSVFFFLEIFVCSQSGHHPWKDVEEMVIILSKI